MTFYSFKRIFLFQGASLKTALPCWKQQQFYSIYCTGKQATYMLSIKIIATLNFFFLIIIYIQTDEIIFK